MTLLALKVFFSKAWEWLKKYWMWVLFPIGLLVLGAKGLALLKRPAPVLPPELVGASQTAESERRIAEQRAREAETARAQKITQVEAEHLDVIRKLDEEQYKKVEELRDDPDKLNEYLLQVGKDMRRDPQ
mgnify:FL=1